MHPKPHRLMISGSSLALSMVLLLAALTAQASATHFGFQKNTFNVKFPPKGAVYTIDIDGSAKIPGKPIVKPVSVDIELKVANVKQKGVPTIHFALTAGKFSFGDDVYMLDKGSAVMQVNKMNIKATSNDGTKILLVTAALSAPLPIKTSEDPVKLVPGQDRKSASIQALAVKWDLTFGGIISRTG